MVIVERVEPIGPIDDTDILQRHNPWADDLETSNNIKKGHVHIVVGTHLAIDKRRKLHTNNPTRGKKYRYHNLADSWDHIILRNIRQYKTELHLLKIIKCGHHLHQCADCRVCYFGICQSGLYTHYRLGTVETSENDHAIKGDVYKLVPSFKSFLL